MLGLVVLLLLVLVLVLALLVQPPPPPCRPATTWRRHSRCCHAHGPVPPRGKKNTSAVQRYAVPCAAEHTRRAQQQRQQQQQPRRVRRYVPRPVAHDARCCTLHVASV
ncbi:hypothetical protein BS50DRAFT_590040 [Corynespora cassiicola Philippines]|uniref:Secreted protein n=1 Tax=Corynespora cassiicola Philippines TaxID=1448308 RepID=A0A2T2NJQ6_CORCC|nr:hypothetical protein BS50DRAFT_590040 [Corynespora cassiicola Philippines]